jgi:hypothetical protein
VLPTPHLLLLDYSRDELLWNELVRNEIIHKTAELGRCIEAALGGPQDIEGVYVKRRLCVVQARPQVGCDS